MRIVLGSFSPRRKEILSYFRLPFITAASHFDEESIPFEGDPQNYCSTLARKKNETLKSTFKEDLIITADTIVSIDKRVFNKPKDFEEAFLMLKFLSGKTHSVYTAICVSKGNQYEVAVEESKVLLNLLSDEEIQAYLGSITFLDKAGSYTIQKTGSLLVKSLEGCFYNVSGLPVNTLENLLKVFGISLWQNL